MSCELYNNLISVDIEKMFMHYEEIKSEFYWRYNVTLLVKEEGKKKRSHDSNFRTFH